jgi:hypothetical protein
MAPTRSSVSKSPDSTTRFRYVADAAVFGQHANRFPSSSLGSPLSFFSQRVSSEFLLTHEPLTCSISPYLITTHSRLTLPESLVGVTSARVPSSRSFESLSHRLHAARHSTASQIKKASVSTLGAHEAALNSVLDDPRCARHRSRAPPPRPGLSRAVAQAWRLEASPAPHCDNGSSRRSDRPPHAGCSSCLHALHGPRHPHCPFTLSFLRAQSSRRRLSAPCCPLGESVRAAGMDRESCNDSCAADDRARQSRGCVWLVDTVVCSVNSGCLERLGSSRGATGRAHGADCCPVHGRRGARVDRVSDPVKPSKRVLPARGRSNVGQRPRFPHPHDTHQPP